jgi:hypothetical protein
MNQRVSVTVNGRAASFFLGLTVRHAIGARSARAVREGRADVRDHDGNLVGLEGALYDGQALFVRDLATSSAPPARSMAASGQKRLRQWAQERLLDDESLRAGMGDEEARVLLAWATAHLDAWIAAALSQHDDEEQVRESLHAPIQRVSAAMRGIAHIVGTTRCTEPRAAADETGRLSGVVLVRELIAFADGLLPGPSGRT